MKGIDVVKTLEVFKALYITGKGIVVIAGDDDVFTVGDKLQSADGSRQYKIHAVEMQTSTDPIAYVVSGDVKPTDGEILYHQE